MVVLGLEYGSNESEVRDHLSAGLYRAAGRDTVTEAVYWVLIGDFTQQLCGGEEEIVTQG